MPSKARIPTVNLFIDKTRMPLASFIAIDYEK